LNLINNEIHGNVFTGLIAQLFPVKTNETFQTPASAITAPPVVEDHQARKGPAVNWTQFEVQLVDLTSAMYYILKDEIPRRQIIEGENLNALKLWIHMLKKVHF
uniref:FAD_SOX domain-containing protein n=1 Tax=Anisakis simplex TaxID=6269 RepID=A0A0M3JJC8_ANISI